MVIKIGQRIELPAGVAGNFVALKNGTLLCSGLCSSNDGGQTWSPPAKLLNKKGEDIGEGQPDSLIRLSSDFLCQTNCVDLWGRTPVI